MNAANAGFSAASDLPSRPRWPYQALDRRRSGPAPSKGMLMNPDDAGTSTRDKRRARLAASLRDNLKRRKAQQRSRAAESGPATEERPPEAAPDAGKR